MDNNPISQNPSNNPVSSAPIQDLIVKKSRFPKKWLFIFLGVILLLMIGGTGGFFLNQQISNSPSTSTSPTPTTSASSGGNQVACTMEVKLCPDGVTSVGREGPNCEFAECPTEATTSADTTNWKTYSSSTEKATFKYPSNWKIVKPALESNIPGADTIGLQSPSGEIKVSWISAADGFGGGCNTNSPLGSSDGCDLFTLIEKMPIKDASGLYVISGTITKDGKIYKPFLAIQDDNGLVKTTRTMGYDMFTGKNNGNLKELNGQNVNVFFTTGNTYGNGPELSKSDADAWFNKPEAIQAKQILSSLSY